MFRLIPLINPSGGTVSKPTIEEQLARIAQLTADELASLETEIQAAFDAAEESENLDVMDAMVTALESVYTAQGKLESEDEAQAEETETETEDSAEETEDEADTEAEAEEETPEVTAEDQSETVKDEDTTDEPEAADEADEPETTEDAEAPEDDSSDETPAEDTTTTVEEPEAATEATETIAEEKLPMAASADFQPPEDAQPIVASVSTAVVAGADISGYSAGQSFESLDDVSQAFVTRINSIKRSGRGGDGEQLSVATVTASIPEDRMLAPGDVAGNAAKVEAVTGQQALVASGGFCAPLAVKYDIFGLGSTVRPVRDGLPGFGATRGGIRYVQPPVLSDYANAVGLWTSANDADPAVDSGTGDIIPKNKLKVQCAAELTAETDAVTLQLEFGNLMSRAYPELVARHNQLALVEHARFAERNLLSKISSESLAVTSAFRLGTARDFLFAIAKAGAAYRNRHRVDRTTPLRVIAPDWVLDAMREDLAMQLPGDSTLADSDAVINSFLAARNVNVTWHVDDTFPSQSAGAIVNFPATIQWFIFAEGTFLFLDGGSLDLGVVRDSALVGTNDYVTFVETFEGIAKVGVESIQVTTTTHSAGATVGTVTPA